MGILPHRYRCQHYLNNPSCFWHKALMLHHASEGGIFLTLIDGKTKVKEILKEKFNSLNGFSHQCLFGSSFENKFSKCNSKYNFSWDTTFYTQLAKDLTTVMVILGYVGGYKILLLETLGQNSFSPPVKIKEEQRLIVQKEAEEMLRKEAIFQVQNNPKQFLSSIFVVSKKSTSFRHIINLKKLNSCVEYNYVKMVGIIILNDLLKKGYYLCKLELKDAYCSVSLHRDSRKYVTFQWQEKLRTSLSVF